MDGRTKNMTQREDFLKRFWKPYPAAPLGTRSILRNPQENQWVGGILSAKSRAQTGEFTLQVEGQGSVVLRRGRELCLLNETNRGLEPLSEWDAEVVLKEGDKVALRQDGDVIQVVLLAPQLQEVQPLPLTLDMARRWQKFLNSVRDYFSSQQFVEVQTPSLVVCPGYEPTLQPLACDVEINGEKWPRFLPTSPEIHLKKIMAHGWEEIFEIRSCFRDGETSPTHQPEFTMLEWYQSYVGLDGLADQLLGLIRHLNRQGFSVGESDIEFRFFTVAQVFRQTIGQVLTPLTTKRDLRQMLTERDLKFSPDDTWSDLFHRLWLEFVEPWIESQSEPLIISQFPPEQAALSRIGESGWAERVELYWRGLEIANGFHELNNPDEQVQRAQQDLQLRKQLGRKEIQNDVEFFKALYSGVPPCSGIAVGLERLFMALLNIKNIRCLKAFPY